VTIIAELLLVLAGGALLFWALLCWRLAPCAVITGADPWAGEIAEFRRQLHDWDRQEG
jgi:hypothetical protein